MIKRRNEKHPGEIHHDRQRDSEAAGPGPKHAQAAKMHPDKRHKAPGIHRTGRMGTAALKISIVIAEPVDKSSPTQRPGCRTLQRRFQDIVLKDLPLLRQENPLERWSPYPEHCAA